MSDLPARFWAYVNKTDTCWNWTGWRNASGYGYVQHNGANKRAHRVAYACLVGLIPDGLTIDHLCNNPSCVRPDHMEAVTMWENIQRKQERRYVARDLCKFGHPLTYATSYSKKRTCKLCRNAASAAYYHRKRAAAAGYLLVEAV